MSDSLDPNTQFIVNELRRLNSSVEKIADKQNEMNVVLAENTVIVKEHERRSLALEKWVGGFETRFVELVTNVKTMEADVDMVEKDLTPIKTHVEKVNKMVNFLDGVPVVLKVIVLVGTVLSALYGVFVIVYNIMPRK